MKTTSIVPIITAMLMIGVAGVAYAQADTGASTTIGVKARAAGAKVNASATVDARIATAKVRADQEIKRRTDMLNQVNAKVQAMMKVSSTEKTNISNMVSAEISNLTSLQTKIDADTDLDTLKVDIRSIATSYRIFMLVIPRARIDVAADKINTAAASLSDLAGKLQARIAQASGDTSAAAAQLADMNAKIADAQVQVNAAVSVVASLEPDNGDKSVQSSNAAILKDARSKIQAGLADLKTARQDAGAIVMSLKGMEKTGASASANTSASGQ